MLANFSGNKLKFKLAHDNGKQTIQSDMNSIFNIKVENIVYDEENSILIGRLQNRQLIIFI